MSPPGIYVAGATTALTRRTVLRKGFLAPWDPRVSEVCVYSLADAQRVTGMAVHQFVPVVSHYHCDVTPKSNNLPEFTRRLNRDISCGLHTLLCEERYDAPRELFDDRPTHKMRLLDAAAQASQLVYDYVNNVAAGFVKRPEHMPQRTFDWGLWKTGVVEVRRPDFYFGPDRPEVILLEITPPPLLFRAFGGDIDALVHHMCKLTDDAIAAIEAERRRPPMGAREVRRIHPWSEPRTLRETGGQAVPTFRLGARGIVGRRQRIAAAREVTAFRQQHHATRLARRDGDRDALYPYGTYAASVYRGEPVEEGPPIGALVAAPGPTLEEVKAELARAKEPASTPHALIDEVRAAFREEAEEIVRACDVELRDVGGSAIPSTSSASSGPEATDTPAASAGEDARPAATTRHRFDPRARDRAPVRIITLRDRRRGPPRGGSARHGDDPPV